MDYKQLPKLIKRFAFLGWDATSTSGDEYIGGSIFHGKENKFYVNSRTGQWQDKYSGHSGNFYTYLRAWHKWCKEEFPLSEKELKDFAKERGFSVAAVKRLGVFRGLFLDGVNWGVPIRNAEGKVSSVLKWKGPGSRLIWCTGSSAGLIGLEDFPQEDEGKVDRLYWVEGPWDRAALRSILQEAVDDFTWAVLAVPGAETFKPEWGGYAVRARTNIVCFDNDAAGENGRERAIEMMANYGVKKANMSYLRWPGTLPDGYDVRDLRKDGGGFDILEGLTKPCEKKKSTGKDEPTKKKRRRGRVSWEDTLSQYSHWLNMTESHRDTLRMIYAVVLSNRLPGSDFAWLHIVSAAGSGKTELLMSVSELGDVVTKSCVTEHSLISGYPTTAGDPSLIPKLIGNTFILKDFTEVLSMAKPQRDGVYKVLRGAYDGKAERDFGNGQVRAYVGSFSMLTGVTQAIDGENGTALGERFLKWRLTAKREATQSVLDALSNVGKEDQMRTALTDAASSFFDFDLESDFNADAIPREELGRIAALAEVAARLRTKPDRDTYNRDRIGFEPEPETPTRIAKQLLRLRLGLAMLHDPFEFTDDDFRLIRKCAMDSTTGFVMAICKQLRAQSWQTVAELMQATGVPQTTCREVLDDLEMQRIGVVQSKRKAQASGPGRPNKVFALTEDVRRLMKQAGL